MQSITISLLRRSAPLSLYCNAARTKPSRSTWDLPTLNHLLLRSTSTTHHFQLGPKTGEAEDTLYSEQIQDLQEWWDSPRFKGLRRDHTAEDVVSKRGTLQSEYPSSLMARKLHDILARRAAAGQPVHTSMRTPAVQCAALVR